MAAAGLQAEQPTTPCWQSMWYWGNRGQQRDPRASLLQQQEVLCTPSRWHGVFNTGCRTVVAACRHAAPALGDAAAGAADVTQHTASCMLCMRVSSVFAWEQHPAAGACFWQLSLSLAGAALPAADPRAACRLVLSTVSTICNDNTSFSSHFCLIIHLMVLVVQRGVLLKQMPVHCSVSGAGALRSLLHSITHQ
jgi:hypothetical protein